jgi:hypothetical protein
VEASVIVPSGPTPEARAVVAVREPVLAASLEFALLAGGLSTILHDPAQGLDELPIEGAAVLILGPHVVRSNPLDFIEGLRARPWGGLAILITGDGETLRRVFERAERVAVLEMPFVGADLIAAIRDADASDSPSG